MDLSNNNIGVGAEKFFETLKDLFGYLNFSSLNFKNNGINKKVENDFKNFPKNGDFKTVVEF